MIRRKIAKKIAVCIIIAIVVMITASVLLGVFTAEAREKSKVLSSDDRFVITSICAGFYTIYDTYTGVRYLTTSHGGTCALLDPDGKPHYEGCDKIPYA